MPHSQAQAKAILDSLRTEPRKPITEIKAKVLGAKPKVPIKGKEFSIKVMNAIQGIEESITERKDFSRGIHHYVN